MQKHLLVCDLDNTLYDWVRYFVPAFYAMVDETVRLTGCDREKLLDDFRSVHQSAHDSEQPFALLETDTIKSLYRHRSRSEIAKILDPAFHAFNSYRKHNLMLYPGVRDTLDELQDRGVRLVAHTESRIYAVADRIHRLGLSDYFRRIYCGERNGHEILPPAPKPNWSEKLPAEKVIQLSHHQAKPNPTVLLEICADEGIPPEESAYVGDSVARDVLMAKRAGIFAIWAKYGTHHDPGAYEALVRVTHWTPGEVARERELREEARTIVPDFVARGSFAEVLTAIDRAEPVKRISMRAN